MRQVIIRDDDTSFFTQPSQLEAIYGRLWEQGLPVCLAVVPAPRGDIQVRHRLGTPFDPGIPPQYRGQARAFPLADNPALCEFLNRLAQQGLVEVCLHGYHHSYLEYLNPDADVIHQKLTDGLRELRAALPDARIETFIAPYDRMSPTAVKSVLEAGLNVCVSAMELAFVPPLNGLSTYQSAQLGSGPKVFTCDEYLFTHREAPDRSLETATTRLNTEALFVCTNHIWCFFHDWQPTARPDLLAAWKSFVAALLQAQDSVHVTTFRQAEAMPIDAYRS
ncbi:MAG: hypothetical protein OHK0023_26790 [Anaerolineae bacterium]